MADRLPFVQLELAGTVGLDEGRYLARPATGQQGASTAARLGSRLTSAQHVLVVNVAGAPAPPRRRFGRAKPKPSDPGGPATVVPLTTLTVIRPEPLGDAVAAERWLKALRDDDDAAEAELHGALRLINRAVHAQRAAVLDPNLADVAAEHALVARIGFGSGDELADGQFSEAFEVPRSARRRLGEALRPQERVAAVLSGGESIPACELLILRARADLDGGRTREAALQMRAGIEALFAERSAFAAPGQEADLAALDERRAATAEAGAEALRGELRGEREAALGETLALAERVLRRERALAAPRD